MVTAAQAVPGDTRQQMIAPMPARLDHRGPGEPAPRTGRSIRDRRQRTVVLNWAPRLEELGLGGTAAEGLRIAHLSLDGRDDFRERKRLLGAVRGVEGGAAGAGRKKEQLDDALWVPELPALHPNMAQVYRDKATALAAGLEREDQRDGARQRCVDLSKKA